MIRVLDAIGRPIVDDAVELLRPPGSDQRVWTAGDTRVTVLGGKWELDAKYEWLRREWLRTHPDEFSDQKLALCDYQIASSNSELLLTVKETEWREVRAFHEAIERADARIVGISLASYLLDIGHSPFPNIATVHGILETADRMLVIAQRSAGVHYHPLHWSASFEEGLAPTDLSAGNAVFHAAAARGANEEFLFSGAVRPSHFSLLAIIAEAKIVNPALVAYGKIPFSSTEILRLCRDSGSNRNELGLGGIQFVSSDLESLASLCVAEDFWCAPEQSGSTAWHPTSRYRLLASMLHRFGQADTAFALREAASRKKL